MIENLGKKNTFIIILHIVVLIALYLITLFSSSRGASIAYLLFSLIFILNLALSLYLFLRKKSETGFYYILSLLLTLGFFIKFSLHEIFKYSYVEPVGDFDFKLQSFKDVLYVATVGCVGLFFSQLASQKFNFRKFFHSGDFIKTEKTKNFIKTGFILTLLSFFICLINLKFNLLLFGLLPSIQLPLKGNVIFFLLFSRGIPFLVFYYLIKELNFKSVLLGSIIASICSIGVLSRMIIIVYFAVIFIKFLKECNTLSIKTSFKNGLWITGIFIITSYATVKISTDLRRIKFESAHSQHKISKYENYKSPASVFSDSKTISTYLSLALDRWIGIEGVMAVHSYSEKKTNLLWSALQEKSYNGRSFYTKIAQPYLFKIRDESSKVRSTSVPGPIAFSYYSGNILIVFFFMFFSTFILDQISKILFYNRELQSTFSIYTAVFIAFDFFQFGIAPIAYLKYLFFSVFCIFAFFKISNLRSFYLQHKRKLII